MLFSQSKLHELCFPFLTWEGKEKRVLRIGFRKWGENISSKELIKAGME